MRPIQNNAASAESQSTRAAQRGLLGLLSKPASKSSGGAESFSREVERAVERQGGKQAIESRKELHSSVRRSKRHASFGSEVEASAAGRSARPDDGPDAEDLELPNQRHVQASQDRRASQARVHAGEREQKSSYAQATSDGGRSSTEQAAKPASGAPEAQHGLQQGLGLAPGTQLTHAMAGAAAAAANAAQVQNPSTGARPMDANQAFVDAAKATGARAASKEAAPTGSTPDPKLLEHAEKVLRQIRVNLRPGMKELTLNLKPVDLGRLSIDLRMQNGVLATVVRAESRETLELLKQQAPELRAILAQQGIETEKLEFKLAFDAGGANAHGQEGAPKRASAQRRRPQTASNETPSSSISNISALPSNRESGGIDTLA